jgi:hypothetical protein
MQWLLNITPVLDKIQEYKRKPRNRLQRIIKKNYRSKGRRNQGRPLKRLLDVRDRSTLLLYVFLYSRNETERRTTYVRLCMRLVLNSD